MTKQEILTEIEESSIKIIAIAQQVDSVKESAGVTSYIANVLVGTKDTTSVKNIGFYVINEEGQDESAYYRDSIRGNNIHSKIKNYIKSLVPSTYIRVVVGELNEELKFATARAYWINADGNIEEKSIFIYNVNKNILHKEIV